MGTQSIDNSLDRLAHEVQWVAGEMERLRQENADLRRQLAEREEVSTTQGATFSPRPWQLPEIVHYNTIINDGNNVRVCTVHMDYAGHCAANARLIAAAPEMYSIIRDFLTGRAWCGDDASKLIDRIEGRQS